MAAPQAPSQLFTCLNRLPVSCVCLLYVLAGHQVAEQLRKQGGGGSRGM